MQYVYCYLKELPANETTRIDAAEWFLAEQTESNLGQVLIAYSIGFLIEAMLEDLAGTGSGSTGRDGQTSMKAGRKTYGQRAREREIIERIIRKRRPRKGNLVVSYRQITQELNDEGYTTRMGKPWYPPRMVRLQISICRPYNIWRHCLLRLLLKAVEEGILTLRVVGGVYDFRS